MNKILRETTGRRIYMQLPNGYFIHVSRKHLKETLVAMYKHNEDFSKIELNTYTDNFIFINLKSTQ